MARTKGSRNKTPTAALETRIETLSKELEELQKQVKAKKADLKKLREEKASLDSQRLLRALQQSGRTTEEILSFLGQVG